MNVAPFFKPKEMAIGQSKLHEIARRRRLLSESVVWFNAFDANLKRKILDWIRDDQLTRQGVDADGDVIGTYSLTTSFINPLKKFNTHFTLDDTGGFYKSMFLQVFADRIVPSANSETYRKMQDQDWYSERILNLTGENIKLLKEEIKGKYIEAVRKVLFGN